MNPVYRKSSTSRVMSDGTTEREEVEESFAPPDSDFSGSPGSMQSPVDGGMGFAVYEDSSGLSGGSPCGTSSRVGSPGRMPSPAGGGMGFAIYEDCSAQSGGSPCGTSSRPGSPDLMPSQAGGAMGFNISKVGSPGRMPSRAGGGMGFDVYEDSRGGSPGLMPSRAGGGMGFNVSEECPAQSSASPCGTSSRPGSPGQMSASGSMGFGIYQDSPSYGTSSRGGSPGRMPSPAGGGMGFAVYEDCSPQSGGSPCGTSSRPGSPGQMSSPASGSMGFGIYQDSPSYGTSSRGGSPGRMPSPAGGGMGFAVYEDCSAQSGGSPCGTSSRPGSPGRMQSPAGGGFGIFEDSPAQSGVSSYGTSPRGGSPDLMPSQAGGAMGFNISKVGSPGRMPSRAGGGIGFDINENSRGLQPSRAGGGMGFNIYEECGGSPCGTSSRGGSPGQMPSPSDGGMGFGIFEDAPVQSGASPCPMHPPQGAVPRRFGNVINLPGSSGAVNRQMPQPQGGRSGKENVFNLPGASGAVPRQMPQPQGKENVFNLPGASGVPVRMPIPTMGGGKRRFGTDMHMPEPSPYRPTSADGSYYLPPPRKPRYKVPAQESPMVVGRDLRADSPVGRYRSPSPSPVSSPIGDDSYYLPPPRKPRCKCPAQESPMVVGRDLRADSPFAPNLGSTPIRYRPPPVGDFSNSRIDALATSHQNEMNDLRTSYRTKLEAVRNTDERQRILERYKNDLHSKQHIHNLEMEALACRLRDASLD